MQSNNVLRLGALLLRRWSQHAPKHPGAATSCDAPVAARSIFPELDWEHPAIETATDVDHR